MRQECLAIDGDLDAARRAGKQAHIQVFLKCGDALGDSLLGDRQRDGSFGELAGVRSGDEGAHRVDIHAPDSTGTTQGCGSPPRQLFDPLAF